MNLLLLSLSQKSVQKTSRKVLLTGWWDNVIPLKSANRLPSQDKTQSFYYELRVLNSLVPALLPTSPLIYALPCSLSSTTMTFLLSSCLRAFAPVCPECVSVKSSLVVTFSGTFSGHWSKISTFNQTSQLLHCFIFPCSTYHYLPYYVFSYLSYSRSNSLQY